jgi:uncharacterized membrane protein HdeD (DUF308 family)
MYSDLASKWWTLALRGVIGILFGIAALAWPGLTFSVLVLLFGAYAFVDGIFAVIASALGDTRGRRWWAVLVEGLIGIGVGLVTFTRPHITALALLWLIAGWAIATGVFEIMAAIRLRKEIKGEWLLGLAGVLSLLFGIAIAAQPAAGSLAIAWIIGVYAIAFGITLIVLGFELKGYKPTDRGRTIPGGAPSYT